MAEGEDEGTLLLTTEKSRLTWTLKLTAIGIALGGVQHGHHSGVLNNSERAIREFINTTYVERTGTAMSEVGVRTLWSLTASIFAIGGCLGSVLAGWWSTKFGRKRGVLWTAVPGLMGSGLMGVSKYVPAYELTILGRLMVGVQTGMSATICPVYLAEISTCESRGQVGTLYQLGIAFGLVIGQVLGFPITLGSHLWNVQIVLACVPCLLQIILLLNAPESPRHLLISANDRQACKKSLVALRGKTDVEAEIEEIEAEKRLASASTKISIPKLLRDKSLRPPLIIGVMMHLIQQFSGINGIFFFFTELFTDAGSSYETATYITSSLGLILVIMTFMVIPLMDLSGRRCLLLISLVGMIIWGILFTIALACRTLGAWFSTVAIVCIPIFVVFFAIGAGPVPWVIVSELFPHTARSAAVSLCVFANLFSNFIVAFIFPFCRDTLKDFVFVPFVVCLVLGFVFAFCKLPETKGKTFEDVSQIWKRHSPLKATSYNAVSNPFAKPHKMYGGHSNW